MANSPSPDGLSPDQLILCGCCPNDLSSDGLYPDGLSPNNVFSYVPLIVLVLNGEGSGAPL